MKLSDTEFWDLTLHELDLLSVRYRLVQEREDRRAALSAWLLANINRDSDNRPTPFEFEEVVAWLGHGFQHTATPPPEEPAPPTVEELRDRVHTLHAMYQGHPNGQHMDHERIVPHE